MCSEKGEVVGRFVYGYEDGCGCAAEEEEVGFAAGFGGTFAA